MILALGTTVIVPAFGYFLDVQDSNYHLLFLLGAVLSLISAVAFVKIHFYYKRFGGDENYIAPDVMTRENILKAGDKFRTFIVHGAVAGVIAGCLLGYWFENPTIRAEYSWGKFYGNFFDVMVRPSYEVGENYLVSQSPKCTVIGTRMKPVPAPVRPWLLSVVTFGLVGMFLGALIPNKRRPGKRGPSEAETA